MKDFPKKIFVTRSEEYEDGGRDYFVDTNAQEVLEDEEEGTEVAVYELVKVGSVKVSRKISFE